VAAIDPSPREPSPADPPREAAENAAPPDGEAELDSERSEADEEREIVERAYEARRRGEVLSAEDLMLLLGR
jgi:hypothetical protein